MVNLKSEHNVIRNAQPLFGKLGLLHDWELMEDVSRLKKGGGTRHEACETNFTRSLVLKKSRTVPNGSKRCPYRKVLCFACCHVL